jgi:hypothetical protein
LALRLLARIVVLALSVFVTWYSNLDGFRPFYRKPSVSASTINTNRRQSTPTDKGRPPEAACRFREDIGSHVR